MREGTITLADGRTLGYAEHGIENGVPVIYCHGNPGGRFSAHDADALVSNGVREITFDRPGYGLSDRKPGRTLVDLASDAAELADALGIDRFAVLGSSLGGPNALAIGHLLGDRVPTIVLACTVGALFEYPELDEHLPPEHQLLLPIGRADMEQAYPLIEAFIEETRAAPWRKDPEQFFERTLEDFTPWERKLLEQQRDRWIEIFAATYAGGAAATADDVVATYGPLGFALEAVDTPVWLYHGALDTGASHPAMARHLEAKLPNAQLTIYDGEAHYLAPEHHDEWLKVATASLRG
jgi:pimeloyl-ACP methyl ester carboxylesterase